MDKTTARKVYNIKHAFRVFEAEEKGARGYVFGFES
jgi:hypothetical protein